MSEVVIKFKRIVESAEVPAYKTDEAACMDLTITSIEYALDDKGKQQLDKVIVKYGFSTEIPPGYKAVIEPRSGFTHKEWFLANSPCQIDSDYRGEWMSKFEAKPVGLSDDMITYLGRTYGDSNDLPLVHFKYPQFPYKVGERVTQFQVEMKIPVRIEVVQEISSTTRGEGGFHSTGK